MLELDYVHLPLEVTTQEITRLCKELEALVRNELPANQTSVSAQPSDGELVALGKSLIKERSDRAKFLTGLDFGEPAWDIVLDLYVNHLCKRQVSISSASIAANVPATTALRHLSTLTSQGFLIRVCDTNDARRVFLILSEEIRRTMREYLCSVLAARHVSP